MFPSPEIKYSEESSTHEKDGWQAAVTVLFFVVFLFLCRFVHHEKCRSSMWLLLISSIRDRELRKMPQTESKSGDDVPLGSHLSWLKGHESICRVPIITSFDFLLFFFFFPSIHLHHLFLLFRQNGHLAPIRRLGHFVNDFSANIWKTQNKTQ